MVHEERGEQLSSTSVSCAVSGFDYRDCDGGAQISAKAFTQTERLLCVGEV